MTDGTKAYIQRGLASGGESLRRMYKSALRDLEAALELLESRRMFRGLAQVHIAIGRVHLRFTRSASECIQAVYEKGIG